MSAPWKLLEKSPEATEPLSALDQLAYGVVRQRVEENWAVLRMRALEEKPLKAMATA